MRDLGLVGLSADQNHVLFFSDTGETFRAPIDDALRDAIRAAARGARQRPEQVEAAMAGPDSALRPRDIQARIRAGESPEAVAAVAEVPVERIMAYAVPVLAERTHVCEQARRAGLRRRHASGPGRPLGQAVDEHLRSNGRNPELASWDSWRREDGRWSVTVAASRGGEPATFLFDLPGRYAFANDDAARRLVGDEPPLSVEPEPDEPRTPAREVTELHPTWAADEQTEAADTLAAQVVGEAPIQVSAGADQPPPGVSELDRLRTQRAQSSDPLPDVEAIARVLSEPAPTQPTARKRRGRRASVPSWDEIMFGSKPNA